MFVDMAAVRLHTYCSEQTSDDEGLYEGLGVSHYRFMINATQSRNSQGGEDGKGNGLEPSTHQEDFRRGELSEEGHWKQWANG